MAEATLRERNKAKRRDAIIDAAIRLFGEKGYTETTIPDIAELAEVAPRTVSLHFPAKLDIVRADIGNAGRRFEESFARRTPDQTALDVSVLWIRSWLLDPLDAQARARLRMYAANEELSALVAMEIIEIIDAAINADPELLAQIGDPVDRHIIGAALAGVVRHLASVTEPQAFEHEFARVRLFFAGGVAALHDCEAPVPLRPL